MAQILIIDDDPTSLFTLRAILEDAGHEVVEATDGAMGGRLYREQPTDLVITDIVMPEKEGLETIVELRTEFPNVKVFAISGGGTVKPKNYLDTAEKLGALKTFVKPIDGDELLAAVEEELET